MLQLARVDHDTALAELRRAGIDAFVGPTDERGWTAVHSDEAGEVLAGLGAAVVDLGRRRGPTDDFPLLVLSVRDDDADVRLAWETEGPGSDLVDGDPHETAQLLVQRFGEGEATDAVEQLLVAGGTETIIDDLAQLVDLPELDERPPEHAVVAVRAAEHAVAMGAAVGGPSRVIDAGDGWWVVQAVGDGEASWELGIAVAGAVTRKDPVLFLGREGTEQTILLMGRRGVTGSVGWAARWEHTADVGDRTEQYAALVKALGEPEIPAHVRALLRRRSEPRGIADLLAMFGVPPGVVAVLDRVPSAPAGRLVERQSWQRASWESARDEVRAGVRHDLDPERPLSVRRAWVNVVVLATGLLVEGGIAVFVLAVILTGGALVDDDSTTWSDIAFVPFAFAATALLAFLLRRALVQLAGARRRARPGSD